MVVACTLGMIPLGYMALSIVVPIIGGIPMMLFYAKVKKFGMILIFEIIFGLVMIFTGMGFYLLIWGCYRTDRRIDYEGRKIQQCQPVRTLLRCVEHFGIR